jgi:hypothetical protein
MCRSVPVHPLGRWAPICGVEMEEPGRGRHIGEVWTLEVATAATGLNVGGVSVFLLCVHALTKVSIIPIATVAILLATIARPDPTMLTLPSCQLFDHLFLEQATNPLIWSSQTVYAGGQSIAYDQWKPRILFAPNHKRCRGYLDGSDQPVMGDIKRVWDYCNCYRTKDEIQKAAESRRFMELEREGA